MSKQGCESICRRAFEFAAANNRRSVTLVEKPNVLRETGGLMTRVFRSVASEFPGIEAWEANIDAICMWMIKNPQDYDVLVAENMFGDIISDLAAGLIGGLGFASSANIGDEYAVFEPTHGSAPKYVGKNVVNPMAMMFTAKLMLDWLGEKEAGDRLENALAAVIAEGKVATYDIKGRGKGDSTTDVAEEVARKVSETVNA
jgi:3-isopropylmalate dehydrogenase